MKTSEAIETCEGWLRHLQAQKEKAIYMQKLASMARNGQQEEARRLMRQLDRQPKVYDGARLEPAVRHLIQEVSKHEN